jgi:hypothetical protein
VFWGRDDETPWVADCCWLGAAAVGAALWVCALRPGANAAQAKIAVASEYFIGLLLFPFVG